MNCAPVGAWDMTRVLVPRAEEELQLQTEKLPASGGRCRQSLPVLPDDNFVALQAGPEDPCRTAWSRPCRKDPEVACFVLVGKPLPLARDALIVGERMRMTLMSKSRNADGLPLPTFSGKAADGSPLRDNHAHAFCLPQDDDRDGFLERVLVYRPDGFASSDLRAIEKARKLWWPGQPDLELVLVGLGAREDYGGNDVQAGQFRSLAESRRWVSFTPFILGRHPKRCRGGAKKLRPDGTWVDGPEDQLRRECELRGLPHPDRIEPVEGLRLADHTVRWLEFHRKHKGGGGPTSPFGYGFRVTFPEPVRGPLALGYGCHFGLGQFVPVGHAE